MKPNDIFNIDKLMTESTQTVNEVNPHNYDSDEDYYNALNAPKKPRYQGKQSPGVNPDDEDYFREIWRKKREAAKKAEQDKDQGVAEGSLEEDKGMKQYWAFKREWRAKHGANAKVPGYDSREYTAWQWRQSDKDQGVAEGSDQHPGVPTSRDELYHHHLSAAKISKGRAKEYHLQQAEKYKPKQGVAEDNAEYDDEAGMVDNNLETLERAIQSIDDIVQPGDNLPEWCQEKIAQAKGMLDSVADYMKSEEENGQMEEDWQKVNKRDKTDGMSRKAVSAYRREHPGSKLKTAVTTKPSKLKKGSKSAKRRKSFCARMSGMKKAHASAKTKRDPNSPINKALRRWNCESVEQLQQMLESQINEIKQRLDPKCWKGKHKEGTKIKGGVRVNNCVPNESVENEYAAMYENKLTEMGAGSIATALPTPSAKAGTLFGGSYSQKNSPFKKTKTKKSGMIKR